MENTPPVRSGAAERAQDDVQALTYHGLYLDIRGTADVKNVSLVKKKETITKVTIFPCHRILYTHIILLDLHRLL